MVLALIQNLSQTVWTLPWEAPKGSWKGSYMPNLVVLVLWVLQEVVLAEGNWETGTSSLEVIKVQAFTTKSVLK